MDQIMRFLAPRTGLGFVLRMVGWVACVTFANAAFDRAFRDYDAHSIGYSLTHAIVVGGPMIAFFLLVTVYQMRLQRRLWHLSRKDGLTGLNNRRSFFDQTEKVRTKDARGVLMMLDADHFKMINDTYGHQAGDRCLQAIAHVLGRNIRQVDILGRLGGEEFAIYLNDPTIETARVIGERLTKPISFTTETHESLSVTLSIGAVVAQPDMPIDTLFARADTALYFAKKNGRGLFVLWTPSLEKKAIRARA